MTSPTWPRRVLMTADATGGVWAYALELARALRPHGVDLLLAVTGPPPGRAARAEARDAGNVELVTRPGRLEWMQDPWDDVEAAGEWLIGLAARWRPDVVHLNGYAHAALPWRAPVMVVAHSCVCSWWRAVHGVAAPAEWDRYRRAVRSALRTADVVVSPTRAMRDALAAEHGPFARSCVIHNARSAATWRRATKSPIVLAVGRAWDDAKNVGALDRVTGNLAWPVYVAGPVAHPEGGQRGLAHARPVGQLPPATLAHWLASAAIFVHPARYEPFGLAPLEAALAGCALVLGDIPSLRELWDGAACFVSPDDDDALRDAVVALIDSPERRSALGERARRRALTYSPERMARAYGAVYGTLMARRAGGAEAVACAS